MRDDRRHAAAAASVKQRARNLSISQWAEMQRACAANGREERKKERKKERKRQQQAQQQTLCTIDGVARYAQRIKF
jgi:hypothetical protein